MADVDHRPPLHVITGPTAAGKSRLAMDLAARHGATILSADSRQIYRGFDIGTAKPSPADRALVPHRGVDVVEPIERYSASLWAAAADHWVQEAERDGRVPLVVGGTGFYLRALFTPLFEQPELDAARRQALARVLGAMTTPDLRRWCAALDPSRAHLGRAQLLRAVEIALLTGRRISALHETNTRPRRHRARYLVVDPGAQLHSRIERRVEAMLRSGWQEEVEGLARTVPPDAPAWNATGYRAIRALVEGAMDRAEALARVVIETRQYAKRQRTWFRHQLAGQPVTRVNPDDPRARAIVDHWWEGKDA